MFHECNIYRDAMRNGCSEADLLALIGAAVRRKKQQHAGQPHNKLNTFSPSVRYQHLQHGNFTAQCDF
jgi:hypothetical protein